MSEQRIRTENETADDDRLSNEELDQVAGGEQAIKHAQEGSAKRNG